MNNTTLVGEDGALPLPWLAEPLAAALAGHRGHALLVHGAPGLGVLAYAFTLAQAWLCEGQGEGLGEGLGQGQGGGQTGPCGRCGSCRLVQAHGHPDLTVLLPEVQRRELDWPLPDDKPDSERKPSRQIRIDDVRHLIDRTTRTSARGRGKVALLHPADLLNLQAANALLKTLEEPPAGTRLLLTTADPATLLPTVRSRCQHLRLPPPATDVASAWLAAQGVKDAAVLLAGCNGHPLDALALAQSGVDAAAWAALPRAVAAGQVAALAGWPVPRALDALQKLCHDAMARAAGGAARYFPQAAVSPRSDAAALSDWWRELQRISRHSDHPWNDGLLLEALVRAGAAALAPATSGGPGAPDATPASPRRPGGTAARGFDTLRP